MDKLDFNDLVNKCDELMGFMQNLKPELLEEFSPQISVIVTGASSIMARTDGLPESIRSIGQQQHDLCEAFATILTLSKSSQDMDIYNQISDSLKEK